MNLHVHLWYWHNKRAFIVDKHRIGLWFEILRPAEGVCVCEHQTVCWAYRCSSSCTGSPREGLWLYSHFKRNCLKSSSIQSRKYLKADQVGGGSAPCDSTAGLCTLCLGFHLFGLSPLSFPHSLSSPRNQGSGNIYTSHVHGLGHGGWCLTADSKTTCKNDAI